MPAESRKVSDKYCHFYATASINIIWLKRQLWGKNGLRSILSVFVRKKVKTDDYFPCVGKAAGKKRRGGNSIGVAIMRSRGKKGS